jgi:hypothetical protein
MAADHNLPLVGWSYSGHHLYGKLSECEGSTDDENERVLRLGGTYDDSILVPDLISIMTSTIKN